MTTLEQIILEKIHRFSQEKQRKVLDFAQTLEAASTVERRAHIWDKIQHIIEEVPREEWDKLPTDGSLNVDHYLYGHPKKG